MLMKPILHLLRHFWRFWLQPFFPWRASLGALRNYPRYLADWRQYERQQPGHPLNFADSQPCLFDATAKTPFDAHYFYQANWAMRNITHNPVALHIDVGSEVNFVGLLSTQIPVGFVDIRPLSAHLPGLFCLAGDILHLPFATNSLPSLSCLHVVEHIGLGRYGDPLNPRGTLEACRELQRVLAVNGNLYFSTPVGKPRVCFNAHRIHSPEQILAYFSDLELVEFSAVTDQRQFVRSAAGLESASYACGLFWLRKHEPRK